MGKGPKGRLCLARAVPPITVHGIRVRGSSERAPAGRPSSPSLIRPIVFFFLIFFRNGKIGIINRELETQEEVGQASEQPGHRPAFPGLYCPGSTRTFAGIVSTGQKNFLSY